MNQPFEFITKLLPLIDSFQEEFSGEMDLEQFALWLNKKVVLNGKNKHLEAEGNGHSIDSYIAAMFSRMSKFSKHYARLALQDSILTSLDDFAILITLTESESMKKGELINQNLMEYPTGIGIINRLLKHELIEELEDSEDRRSKRVKLSEKGREELNSLFGGMSQTASIISGDLENNEKLELLTILSHLDRFHSRIYHEREYNGIEDLFKKMNGNGREK